MAKGGGRWQNNGKRGVKWKNNGKKRLGTD
jgi:hypothetical protein